MSGPAIFAMAAGWSSSYSTHNNNMDSYHTKKTSVDSTVCYFLHSLIEREYPGTPAYATLGVSLSDSDSTTVQ